MIYVVWHVSPIDGATHFLKSFYDWQTAISYADVQEAKFNEDFASEGWEAVEFWVDPVEVE